MIGYTPLPAGQSGGITGALGMNAWSAGFVGPLDGYATGLGGAYSVSRRLLSSYMGALIRVRRDSDGNEADIGFDAAGLLDVNALLAFSGLGSAYIVTIYDQSGLGRHVTCSSLSNQLRIVDSVVLEVVGSNGRPNGYAVNGGEGPYVSATFTANTSATLAAVSSFFMSSAQVVTPRYLALTKDSGLDYWGGDNIGVFVRQDANARLATVYNYAYPSFINAALGNTRSAYFRATGSQTELNIGGTSATSAFSTTLGFNRVALSGQGSGAPQSEAGDRQMEHVIWQTDIGATAAAAIRAEQEAFYA
ncbi:MAG: arabinofuranosidase catalytic domain-containing protein [Prosthecobacter sp.]